MHRLDPKLPLVSICLRCRDGRENDFDGVRGGTRLAEGVLVRLAGKSSPAFQLRGVNCMSQCKRPCTIALSAPNRFTYLFGDLDPYTPDHIDALLALPSLYMVAPEGFLRREERPEPRHGQSIFR